MKHKLLFLLCILCSNYLWAQTGNVGIGTSSPSAKLHVVGPATTGVENDDEGTGLKISNGSGQNAVFYINDNGDIEIRKMSDSEVFTITAGGSSSAVGIGINLPTEKLHVAGNVRVDDLAGVGVRMITADGNGVLGTQAIPSGADGVISNVSLGGTNLTFTGANGGFNSTVDLSSLKDNLGNHTATQNLQIGANNALIDRGQFIGSSVAGHTDNGTTDTRFGSTIGGSFTGMAINSIWDGSFNDEAIVFSTHNGGINAGVRMIIDPDGEVSINDLSGSGTRMITADASGVLSTQAIPSGADGVISNVSFGGTNLTFTGANGGFNSAVDLSSLKDNLGNHTATQDLDMKNFSTLFTDPQNANTQLELTANDASFPDDGLSVRALSNPADGEPIFRVLSSGGAERLRVEHVGKVFMDNNLEVGGLAGVGTRMAVVDADGLFSTQALPSGDNLGNHTATENIKLSGNWLSNDGGSEGVSIANNGNVGISSSGSTSHFSVAPSSVTSGNTSIAEIRNAQAGNTTDVLRLQNNNCGALCSQSEARNLVIGNKNGTNDNLGSINFVAGITMDGPTSSSIVAKYRDTGNNYSGLAFSTRDASGLSENLTIRPSGNVGVGETNPSNALDVDGYVEVGDQNSGGTDVEGAMRYNSSNKCMQFHNGTEWKCIGEPTTEVFTIRDGVNETLSGDGGNLTGNWVTSGYGAIQSFTVSNVRPGATMIFIVEVMYHDIGKKANGAYNVQYKLYGNGVFGGFDIPIVSGQKLSHSQVIRGISNNASTSNLTFNYEGNAQYDNLKITVIHF